MLETKGVTASPCDTQPIEEGIKETTFVPAASREGRQGRQSLRTPE